MRKLVIIGARGYGREVFGMAHDSVEFQRGDYEFKGFLDDKTDVLDGYPCAFGDYPPILGPVETYQPQPEDVFLCALGSSEYRRKYADMILEKGGEFTNLTVRSSHVCNAARIGKGVIIGPWCTISTNVEVGDFTMVHSFTTVGHDVRIGAFCSIESYVFFGGYSRIGDSCTMHVRSAIIPHKHVGNNVSVGFGSVVMRNFGDDVSLFGNPARKIDF